MEQMIITHDPKRHVFYIDVGDMDPKDVLAYLEKVREEYKRKRDALK
jgi:hypothetical protein